MLLPSHGVVDFRSRPREHGVNSLFKYIKIQRMQVFGREDDSDCCYSVKIYLSRKNLAADSCII